MHLESAIAIPQENADSSVEYIGNDQIEFIVAIEIAYGNRDGSFPGWIVYGCLESPIAIPEQNAHIARPTITVNDRQIQPIVTIEVARCDCGRIFPSSEVGRSLKRPISVTEQNAHPTIIPLAGIPKIGHSKVELAIPVEIPGDNGARCCAYGIVLSRHESYACTHRDMARQKKQE